jgi:guanylate kinase
VSESVNFNLVQPQPLMIVISGPSGVGKDAVIDEMRARKLPFHFVVTTTTRPPRDTEVDGVDYIFITHDQFAEMINQGKLLEHNIVYQDYKGIPKEQVQQALASGQDVVMRVDVQGAARIRELYPDALLIFLTAADEQEMIDRLTRRKSETPEGLMLRIATARTEVKRVDLFDYVVINRDACLGETVNTIVAIITAEHHRVNHRKISL